LVVRLLQRRYPRWSALDHGAHCEGRRYIVHSDELLSAFLELEETLL
jgi:hypothetical protein